MRSRGIYEQRKVLLKTGTMQLLPNHRKVFHYSFGNSTDDDQSQTLNQQIFIVSHYDLCVGCLFS